jgi:prepilin-type N-terminal cleavage/methylation domain-containing protein
MKYRPTCAFTFVEVMVTLVILTSGIVIVYKTYFLCVDYLSRLTMRLHASELIDVKMGDITRTARETGDMSFDRGSTVVQETIDGRGPNFYYQINAVPALDIPNLYQVTVQVSWMESGHSARLSRGRLMQL